MLCQQVLNKCFRTSIRHIINICIIITTNCTVKTVACGHKGRIMQNTEQCVVKHLQNTYKPHSCLLAPDNTTNNNNNN